MNYNIFKFIRNYTFDPFKVNRLIVSAYVRLNQIMVVDNIFLQTFLIVKGENEEEDAVLEKFVENLTKEKQDLSIEDLIELFEFVVSPKDKEVNGAVYTPAYIRNYIVEKILLTVSDEQLRNMKFGDIACGCGGFFYTLSILLRQRLHLNFEEIFSNYLYGVDIQEYSIVRTKLLLTLLAIAHQEDKENFQFNLFVGNSLDFDWRQVEVIREHGGFDVIVGNPPYVGASKIDEESKDLLKRWEVTKIGKPDLYIPFFQIGIENLRENGILGYITVNNFYRSLNGRGIRSYLSKKLYGVTILDFGSEQVFRGRSTYTCICFIEKNQRGEVKYAKTSSKEIGQVREENMIVSRYETLSDQEGWLLQNEIISKNIRLIEQTGKALGKCFSIRNGFATLKNDVFVFLPDSEDDKYYYFHKKDDTYKVERSICRDAIKPNTLKHENELTTKTEKLIFPYDAGKNIFGETNALTLMKEEVLKEQYPETYQYLNNFRFELSERDKGKREYEAWYAFGRSQAINIYGYKLLFPYISDNPYFVLAEQPDLLFYNGYALVSDDLESLQLVQKVLLSRVFWYYIQYTSKPYGSNYYALAKNYVKNFGLYSFSEEQRRQLLAMENKEEINDFLVGLYGVDL